MRRLGSLARLQSVIRGYESALIAYSGGVDSAFLAYVASRCLAPGNLLAVTACSPTYPEDELRAARELASQWGLAHTVIRTRELQNRSFARNAVDRCFHCKKELFSRLQQLARRRGLAVVMEASTRSDLVDYRPGNRAKAAFGIRSPLIEAGLDKRDVRRLARGLLLPVWNKPSYACLASRVPYGMRLNAGMLKQIERGERFLRGLGFLQVRVRHYGSACRIEITPREFDRFLKKRKELIRGLKQLGYTYITLDAQGFRSGSMNEVIGKP